MFPRRQRLSREAFPAALKGGKHLSSHNFSILIPKDAKGYAIVVSKKVVRLSVTRHRIKRRVLVALKGFLLPPALIVFPRASVGDISYQDIRTELSRLLSTRHT